MDQSAIIPHDMGVTLPRTARYTDARFLRVREEFKLDYADALELTAFLHLVPVHAARHIFSWNSQGQVAAHQFLRDPEWCALAKPLVEENLAALNMEAALRIFEAMKEGGWRTHCRPPPILRDMVSELRAIGNPPKLIAEKLGIPVQSVWAWTRPPSKHADNQRARAVASLAI